MYIKDSLWAFNTRDLMRASSCEHCTLISVARTLGVSSVLEKLLPYEEALAEAKRLGEDQSLAQKYGLIFEDALVNELKQSLPEGVLVSPEIEGDFNQTLELMRSGVPIIFQGGLKRTYLGTIFSGRPDFLVHQGWELVFVDQKLTAKKKDSPSNSESKYTAWDAKYGGSAKPAYLLQVGLYVDALESVGFKAEAKHGLILGSRTLELLEEIEIVPAMKLAREKIVAIVAEGQAALANDSLGRFEADQLSWHCPSKPNCEICEYPDLCEDDRHQIDDLVLVANITKNQIGKLADVGITTMHALASATDDLRPAKMTEETFNKIRLQAKAQVESLSSGNPVYYLLPDPELQYLPKPAALDIFFDFEGFPYFIERGGLEYLFGNFSWASDREDDKPHDDLFTEFWAHNREQEKLAFIGFMEWALDRMRRDPDAHIYHYASYENTALKRLASRHGVFEAEVAWLINTGRLVDMYYIVKNSMIVGEESYSIKKLERFYGLVRSSDVTKASASIDEYDRWVELNELAEDLNLPIDERRRIRAEADAVYKELRLYNLEDVWSTRELYRWLSNMPGASTKDGLPEDGGSDEEDGNSGPSKSEIQLAELQAQTQAFFDKVKDWDWGKDPDSDYRALVWLAITHSILFYKREEVMFWADVAQRVLMDEGAMSEDRSSAAIGDVTELDRVGKVRRESGAEYLSVTYSAFISDSDLFTPEPGMRIIVRYRAEGNRQRRDYGQVVSITDGEVVFTRQCSRGSENYQPNAIIDITNFPTTAKQKQLRALADRIAEEWITPENEAPDSPAIMHLLMRRAPKLKTLEALPKPDPDNYVPAVIEAISDLDNSVLAIQGPPGSGKTFLASRAIAALIKAGKRVGVTANSHSAIENVLAAAIEAGVNPESIIKVQKEGEQRIWVTKTSNDPVATWLRKQEGAYLVAGTSFFFCSNKISEHHLDYLFIDEAAQYSLVDCMAVSSIADNIVLMGDPQQLAQVVQAVHPGGVENSALGHYMGDQAILPSNMGYFLEITRRLHPEINKAVSWLSYEGKLRAHESTSHHSISQHDQGLHLCQVKHSGNSTSSEEEAEAVIDLAKSLHAKQDPTNVLIVAAYNAQVDLIREKLDSAGLEAVMVGTVDKFQGREGMAVIYSFAASSSLDAPRGLEFLLDRNRLNVAISRAKATCYLVFSETLLQSQFRTVAEVKAVSRLAGLLEMAVR